MSPVSPYAKALYAVVMAGLTAAAAIYVDVTWLTIVIAALVPLGVYLVPNTPEAPEGSAAEPRL